MHKVVEAVCDEVSRLIQCAPSFSGHGVLQVRKCVDQFKFKKKVQKFKLIL